MAPNVYTYVLPAMGASFLVAYIPWLAAKFWRQRVAVPLLRRDAVKHFEEKRKHDMQILLLVALVYIPLAFIPFRTMLEKPETLAHAPRGVATWLFFMACPAFYTIAWHRNWSGGCMRRALQPGFAYGWLLTSMVMHQAMIILSSTKDCDGRAQAFEVVMAIDPLTRLVLSVVNRQTRAAAFWNGASSIVLLTLLKLQQEQICSCLGFPILVARELAQYLLIVLITRMFEMAMKAEAASAASAHSERQAMFNILNATCDAVVQLDAGRRISGHCPKLASILLRNTAFPALHGEPFSSLLAPESPDGASAAVAMATMLEAQQADPTAVDLALEMATAHQVALLDRFGNKVQMKAFCTPRFDLDGTLSHLIGLSELGDQQNDSLGRSMQLCSSEAACSSDLSSRALERTGQERSWKSFNIEGVGDEEEISTVRNAVGLVNGRLQETPSHVRQRFLYRQVCSWNVQVADDACCHYHAYLATARRTVQAMQRVDCREAPQPLPLMLQCTQCLRLQDLLNTSSLCGECEAAPDIGVLRVSCSL